MAQGNNSGDLFSSGKLVVVATASVFQQKSTENVDKKEVAGAAADILHAASTYGKLEDKPAGKYIENAEGYQKEFSTGHAADAEQPAAVGDAPPPKPEEPAPAEEAPKEPVPAPAAEEGGKSKEGFGLDDFVKGAEQLVEKQGGGEESAGGTAGGLFKMAQGFLK